MRAYVGADDLAKVGPAMEESDRAVVVLCRTKANCKGLGHGEPVEVVLTWADPEPVAVDMEGRAQEIVEALEPPQPFPEANPPAWDGSKLLTVFLAAVAARLDGRDPPGHVPADSWWRWVPAEQRLELARSYVRDVERAEAPSEALGTIPWKALTPFLGVP